MVPEGLTEAERRLWACYPDGATVDLTRQDGDREIRARVISALLLGACEAEPGRSPGVRLRGARITGRLELRAATAGCPLVLSECVLDEAPQFMESTTRTVRFVRCRMPGLGLARLHLDGLLSLRGSIIDGEVRLDHARIEGEIHMSGAVLGGGPEKTALYGEGLRVSGMANFDRGFAAKGSVRLTHARFGGRLNFTDASVEAAGQWAALLVDNSQIEGPFTLSGAEMRNPGGVAVSAGGITAHGSVWMNNGFRAEGEVRFIGATLRGHLTLNNARLDRASLNLEGAVMSGLEGRGLVVDGGQVRLVNAQLISDVVLPGARVTAAADGVAFAADGMTAATVKLDGLHATGRVSLRNARIGEAGLDQAVLVAGQDGYALRVDRAHAGALSAEGLTAEGRVTLRGATFAGDVRFGDARLTAGEDDLAFVADGMDAAHLALGGAHAVGLVSLDDARVTGELDLRLAVLAGGAEGTALSAAGLHAGGVRAARLRAEGLLVFDDAQVIREVDFSSGSLAADETGLSLSADGLAAGGLTLESAKAAGRISLRAAEISGDVNLVSAEVGRDLEGRALSADGLQAVHVLGWDAGIAGRISLRGAQVVGDLDLRQARIAAGLRGVSLVAGGMSAARINLDDVRAEGRVSMRGTQIARDISARNARATADEKGYAFTVEGSTAVNIYLSGLEADGVVSVRGTTVTSVIDLAEAVLRNPGGIALGADWLTTGGIWAPGLTAEGRIMLRGSQVSGEVRMEGSRLEGDGAKAIVGDGLSAGSLRMNRARITGEVALRGARIVDMVDGRDAVFAHPGNVALRLSLADVTGDVFLGRSRIDGVLRVAEAKIGRILQLTDADLENPGGYAVEARGLQAGRLTLRPDKLVGAVDLEHARLGVLCDDATSWPEVIGLNGLTYEALEPRMPAEKRLEWLRRDEDGFQPQPYEQLAAHYTQTGQEREAQAVLLARERRQSDGADWTGRVWGRLQDATVGFGYQPLRAATWLALLVALGSIVFAVSPPQPIKADEHPHFNAIIYTLDLLLPIVDLGQERAFNPAGADQWFSFLLVAAGWILASTIAAAAARTIGRR
ncbi:hypothetical protein EDD29_0848 [Actinocorallia herbida]|uniref:Membrane-associated oxidoreductase n=1 Tax=Actinocorallia herbida TaxID=58109 RepID=A0A3N1CPU3_9ACTN|nr:hypothetical protein [Actinocorallia herbida]ROO83346.1 hypothetical protein EDD29_0848 [Actinocorallia herbida]